MSLLLKKNAYFISSQITTYKIMKVFSNLSDHAWKRGTQQFLHVGRPGIIPTVNFKIVDPLRKKIKALK